MTKKTVFLAIGTFLCGLVIASLFWLNLMEYAEKREKEEQIARYSRYSKNYSQLAQKIDLPAEEQKILSIAFGVLFDEYQISLNNMVDTYNYLTVLKVSGKYMNSRDTYTDYILTFSYEKPYLLDNNSGIGWKGSNFDRISWSFHQPSNWKVANQGVGFSKQFSSNKRMGPLYGFGPKLELHSVKISELKEF